MYSNKEDKRQRKKEIIRPSSREYHSMILHFSKDVNYEICKISKSTRVRREVESENRLDRIDLFDYIFWLDHVKSENWSRGKKAWKWNTEILWFSPTSSRAIMNLSDKDKDTSKIIDRLQRFSASSQQSNRMISDNSRGNDKILFRFGVGSRPKLSHHSDSNGVVERAMHRMN